MNHQKSPQEQERAIKLWVATAGKLLVRFTPQVLLRRATTFDVAKTYSTPVAMSFLSRLFGPYDQPKPVELPPIGDPVFGNLTWDSKYGWWQGSFAAASGETFTVIVDAPSDEETHPNDDQRKAFQKVVPSLAELKMLAVRDYLPYFNADGVEGEPYTEAELSGEVVPGDIHVESDLDVTVSWLDTPNELLGGHSLTARVSLDGEANFGLEG